MKLRPAVVLLAVAVPLSAPSSFWLITPLIPRAVLAQPDNKVTAHFAAGEKLTNARQWEAAIREYDAVLALKPDSLYTLSAGVMRGMVNSKRRQYKAAIADFTRTIDLGPQITGDAATRNFTVGMAHRERGLAYAKIGKNDEAIEDFDAALQADPRDVEALIGRGLVKMESLLDGDPMKDLEAAVKLRPRSAEALAARGDGKRGSITTEARAKASLPDYDAALALDKDNSAALYGRAQARAILAKNEAERQAVNADLNRAIELDPDNVDYYVTRAMSEVGDKPNGPAAAIADYGRAITLEPDRANRYLDRAMLQAKQPTPDDVQLLSDYNKAIGLTVAELKGRDAPDEPLALALKQSTLIQGLCGRGEMYLRQNKLQEAITDFNDAINVDDINIRAIAGRGRVLIRVDKAQMAISEINAAMPRAREASIAGRGFAVRGAAFLELEQWQDALVDLNAAIKDDSFLGFDVFSQNPELYFNRGRAYNGLDQNDKALADFNIAVKLDPAYAKPLKGTSYEAKLKPVAPTKAVVVDTSNTPTAHKLRGNEWRTAKDDAKAIAEYNKALEMDVNYPDAYANRGSIYRAQGQNDKALDDYNKAIALKPDDARFLYNRGALLLALGKTTEGTADIQKSVALDPQNSQAMGALGTAQQSRGKFAEAEASYTKQLALAKTDEDKHLAQVRLIIVRAAQNKAPTEAEMTMILGVSLDELKGVAASLTKQLRATPNVAALKALRDAVAAKIAAIDERQLT